MIAVTGPSGSSKSTLFNIIGCIDDPIEGSHFLMDKPIDTFGDNEKAELRNSVFGFVAQDLCPCRKIQSV